jgi:hypothetical protein
MNGAIFVALKGLKMDKYVRNQSRVKTHRVSLPNAPSPGRPPHTGFTPADVVSAVLELKLREIGSLPGAMQKAVEHVKSVFIDISGMESERIIYRDWSQGKTTAQALSSQDLLEIIKPYKVKPRK